MTSLMEILALAVLGILMTLPLAYVVSVKLFNRDINVLARFLTHTAQWIDVLNEKVGRGVAWLALFMVLVQTIVVLQRYVFGINFIWMQESITYMHGILFMVAAGFTLLHGGHVRVDIFYREAHADRKALIDFIGTYLFLFPVMAVIWYMAFPYVEMSWRIGEGSTETSGIQGVYILKSVILVFAALMSLQGLSLASRSALQLTGHTQSNLNKAEGPAPTF